MLMEYANNSLAYSLDHQSVFCYLRSVEFPFIRDLRIIWLVQTITDYTHTFIRIVFKLHELSN
jgi:hypothetical protein